VTTGDPRAPGRQRRLALRRGLAALATPWALGTVAALGSAAAPARAFGRDDGLRIELAEARALHEAGRALLVDIREADEHATGVARGALLMPTSQLGRRWQELPREAGRPLLLICATQARSSRAARALKERGFADVRFVHGGMVGWVEQRWPVVAPPRR
jgi:rhodanese-related sulfurtransferase